MSDTPKEGDLHTEAGLLRTMKEALAAEREWRARLERELAQMQKMLDEAQDTAIRWFMAASPYATPGSLESGLDRLRACESALMDLYEANAKGVFSVPDEHYGLITNAAELLKPDPLAVIAALRRKGWNSAIRRAAEVAEHYAKLMNSEAAQRVADEIRAMLSEGKP
jgi:hypothetical protein